MCPRVTRINRGVPAAAKDSLVRAPTPPPVLEGYKGPQASADEDSQESSFQVLRTRSHGPWGPK